MSGTYLLVSLLYALFGVAVVLLERGRTRGARIDAITVFVVLFLLQCCIPGIVIYAVLPFVDATAPTGNDVFDRILQATNLTNALLVLTMTVWFAVFFYIGSAVGRMALARYSNAPAEVPARRVAISNQRLLLLLTAGLAITMWSFALMGDSLVTRYVNLILFRAGYEAIERTFLNANAFALTQAWSWLSVVALFAVRERRGRGLLWFACLAFITIFAVLGVSRRALFLPVLLAYLTLVLYDGRWRVRWLMAACVPLLFLVAFGKDTLAAVAWGGQVENLTGTHQSLASALLRAMADMGITIVESLGTLALLTVDLRFGIDHVLSIAQRFPEGALGFDLGFPERIVRISTATFADANAQDIPPGLFGQMWLDFGVLGPVAWGLLFGLQMSVLGHFFARVEPTRQSAVLVVLLTFVVALPLNTGSFDFTFSVDIFALLLALWWCTGVGRPEGVDPGSPGPAVGSAR